MGPMLMDIRSKLNETWDPPIASPAAAATSIELT